MSQYVFGLSWSNGFVERPKKIWDAEWGNWAQPHCDQARLFYWTDLCTNGSFAGTEERDNVCKYKCFSEFLLIGCKT